MPARARAEGGGPQARHVFCTRSRAARLREGSFTRGRESLNPLIGGALAGPAPLSPTQIFAPASTPARSIFELSIFVLIVAAAIFVVVFGLLTYAVWKYKRKKNDDGREPPQIYGSNQIELAWTITTVLIVLVLFLATARVVAAVQNPPRPQNALEVTAVDHQLWREDR